MKNSELASALTRLTQIVERMTPPIPAIPPILPIPAIPPLPTYSNDHDLLTKLDTKVDILQTTVNDIAKREDTHVTVMSFNSHITDDDKIHADHETRMRGVELSVARILTWGSAVMVTLGLAEFVILKVWK